MTWSSPDRMNWTFDCVPWLGKKGEGDLGLVVTSTLVQFGQSPHTCKHFQAHYPSSNEAFAVENMVTDLKKYLTHLFNIFLVSHSGPDEGDEKHYNRNQQNHEYCHLNRNGT